MSEKTITYNKSKHGRVPLLGKLSNIKQDQNAQAEAYALRLCSYCDQKLEVNHLLVQEK